MVRISVDNVKHKYYIVSDVGQITCTYIARVIIINSTTAQQVQIATLYTMLNEKRSV